MTTIYKAHRTVADEPVPDLHLTITTEIPSFIREEGFWQKSNDLYRTQAEAILAMLKRTLPGGTMHALLVAMLEDKASLLRVRDLPTETP